MAYVIRKSDAESGERSQLKEAVHVSDLVRVDRFDPKTLTVDVTILTKKEIDAKYESQRPVVNVPCVLLQFGRFIIRPWYQSGDIGLLIYNDMDTDMAMMDGSESEPNTPRKHAPEDAKFLGGVKLDRVELPDDIPPEALVICNENGDTFWSMQDDKMQSKGKIEHEGDIDIVGNIKIVGNIDITGNTIQKGDITVQGGDIVADGISLKKHIHTGDSGGNTGPPKRG